MKLIVIILLLATGLNSSHADPSSPVETRPLEQERPELGRLFDIENVTGTFVVFDLSADTYR
ncbi:MAG: hypothetical protein JWL90_4384, partial [Chthoniobacteraceae bacterium]|nr:hypothetical protein [Chthoniobacteraceae bacterium]